jgi:Tol biopolymer transport system component
MTGVTKAMLRLRPWVALIAGAIGCQSGGGPTELQVEPPGDAAAAPVPTVHHRIVFTSDVLGLAGDTPGVYTIRDDGTGLTLLHQKGRYLTSASWSPAGPHRIAFVESIDLDSRAAVINSDGTGLQYLASSIASIAGLSWAPEGKRLAYVDQALGSLKVVYTDGSRLVTIASGCCLHPPAWHPGGNLIAYFQSYDSPRSPADDRGIWTVKPDGTGRTKILDVPDLLSDDYQSVRLSYSPDGTKLAFCHESLALPYEPMPLEVLNADGSGRVVLDGRYCLNTNASWPEAMWKADGSRLLAKTNYTGTQWDLVSVAPDGSAGTRLTTDGYASDSRKLPIAAWSRQGTMIAQVTQSGVNGVLRLMSADGTNKTVLSAAVFTAPWYGGVAWGP